jgi:putative membrane protein
MTGNTNIRPILWTLAFLTVLVWSGIAPKERFTWFLEVAPAIVGAAVLWATRRRFPLTPLTYVLILLHAIILMVGGRYTYAEVPLFDWIRDVLGHERNNYDKLGHFAQGFVPAIIAREVLIRRSIVNGRAWRNFLVVSFCLALSAVYELIEWWVSVATGSAGDAFLGTQGYVWDTQSDMALALVGAVVALVLMGRWHDRQIRALGA